MRNKLIFTFIILFVAGSLFMKSDIALAQSNTCSKLNQTLRSLDRNRDYRSYKKNNATYQTLAKELKKQESQFVRGGCQKLLNSGQKLTNACRTLARRILKGRSRVEKLKNSLATAQAVAQQRKQILQQIAARGCNNQNSNSRSGASIKRNNQQAPRTLLDILFGNNGGEVEIRADDDFGINTRLSTIRTVCVRACDGYFWPISFSTTKEYLLQDSAQCQAEGKGANVELYYYNNPGGDPKEMVSITGQPYKSLPNAFRYQNEYDEACRIKRQTNYGSIILAKNEQNNQSRMMVKIKDLTFPLPLRDPRRTQKIISAKAIFVQLPKPRPLREGEENSHKIIKSKPVRQQPIRTYISGGKIVRIVGPDTPYAQSEAKGT